MPTLPFKHSGNIEIVLARVSSDELPVYDSMHIRTSQICEMVLKGPQDYWHRRTQQDCYYILSLHVLRPWP
jgi:hypothetical protein